MTSVAGNEKLGSNFSLLSLEATAASKQLNEMTSCLGFTHLWPNLLKSLSKHNSLPVSYQPFSFLLPFTIVWSTFGCLVTIPCTEQIRMHFQLCFFFFFFSQRPTIVSREGYSLLPQDCKWPPSSAHYPNCKCSLFGNGLYSNAHTQSSSNSGRAQTAVTAIIFWLCINSLSRSLDLVTAFFLVWKMTWLIGDKHWSSLFFLFPFHTCTHACMHAYMHVYIERTHRHM